MAASKPELPRAPTISPMPEMLALGDVRGPDFICIGAQKGGTRWLYDQLDHHPQFWMPPIKELHYFDLSQRYTKAAVPLYARARAGLRAANRERKSKNQRPLKHEDIIWLEARFWLSQNPLDFDRYARLFNPRGNRLSGDICPPYAIIPEERAAAIRTRFPDTKILYLARDPVERLWSQYCMAVRRKGRGNPAKLSAVRAFVENSNGVEHSRISGVVQRWRLQPNDDRFGFYFFDDLRKDATALRKDILQFLGAKEHTVRGGVPADFNRKKKLAKVTMPDAVRDYLVALFADEIRLSADAFGDAAVDWRNKYDL